MRKIGKKFLGILMGIFNSLLAVFILMRSVVIISEALLRAGYIEALGTTFQFLRVAVGFPLLFLMAIGFFGLVIYVFNYYLKTESRNKIMKKFSFISSIEFYTMLVIFILYNLAFSIPFLLMDWLIISLLFILGSIFMYFYKNNGKSNFTNAVYL